LWTYRNNPPTPTGNTADADVTSYGFSYVPGGTSSTTTDATGKNTWTTTTTDLLGHHITKSDPDAGTSYTVEDNAGLLVQTQDARGQYLSYYYDNLGRKAAEYNTAWTGSNSTLPASSTQLAGWTYDTAPSSDGKSNRGLPAGSTRYTDGGVNAYTTGVTGYDAAGRSLGDAVTIPAADGNGALAGTYQTNNSYTPVTGLLDHTDLSAAGGLPAETVYNSYNVNGLLLAAGGNADYVVATSYDQVGRILSRTLGDYPYQMVQQNLYDAATGRVSNTFTDTTAGQSTVNPNQLNTYSIDDVSYTYDASGRLTSTADLQNWTVSGSYQPGPQARDLQCYAYDYAGRLTSAWADKGDQTPSATTNLNSPTTATGALGSCASSTSNNPPANASSLGGPAPYWQSYGFDAGGSLTGDRSSVTDHDPTGNTAKDTTRTSTYPAAGSSGPNLLSSVTATGGTTGTDSYGYDAAGNTTTRTLAAGPKQALTWDPEGHLATVTDSSTTPATTSSYLYDADGNQLIRRDNGTTTLYLGSTELYLNTKTGAVTGNRYYDYPGAPSIVAASSGALTYEIANNQGTGSTTVNATTGQVLARRYFKPYGDPRGTAATTWPDDHTFLGKTTDTSAGLVDIGARKYDPTTGRFISVDPLFEADDPQSLGGYAYAGDDPVSASDPSGLDDGCDPWFPISCAWNSLFDTTNNAAQKYLEKPMMAAAEDLNPLPDIWHCTDSIDLRCASGVVSVVPLGRGVGLFAKFGAKADDIFRVGRDADDAMNGTSKLGDIGMDDGGDPSMDPNGTGADPGGPVDHGDDQAKAYEDNQNKAGKPVQDANDAIDAHSGAVGDTLTETRTPMGAAKHAIQVSQDVQAAIVLGAMAATWFKALAKWFRNGPWHDFTYKPKHAKDSTVDQKPADDSGDGHVRGHHLYE
uniref:RHS repeat-associated core domain-containing protein n=1 Tax=Streptacidiphilus anmyonensis TaxID=405782 RepID=UPI001364DFBC